MCWGCAICSQRSRQTSRAFFSATTWIASCITTLLGRFGGGDQNTCLHLQLCVYTYGPVPGPRRGVPSNESIYNAEVCLCMRCCSCKSTHHWCIALHPSHIVTHSKLVATPGAPSSFLLLLVRHLFLVAWHLFLVASCYY